MPVFTQIINMNSNNYELFVGAIKGTNAVELTFNSREKGKITRKVIPTDYGPSRRFPNLVENRYHVLDLESPSGTIHPIPITESQIVELKVLAETFNPAEYITWTPQWFVARDWGMYS